MPTLTDAWEIRMQCAENPAAPGTENPSAPVTIVRLEAGWSRASMAPCVVGSATNRAGESVSDTVTRSYPPDCLPLPEATPLASLLVGLLALGAFCARRRRPLERLVDPGAHRAQLELAPLEAVEAQEWLRPVEAG